MTCSAPSAPFTNFISSALPPLLALWHMLGKTPTFRSQAGVRRDIFPVQRIKQLQPALKILPYVLPSALEQLLWIKSVMPLWIIQEDLKIPPIPPFCLGLVLRKEENEKSHKHKVLQDSNIQNLALFVNLLKRQIPKC